MTRNVDVAIIGGGPAGSTAAALLCKYAPKLKVLVLERETFPRDHVGESLLPGTCRILHEMGCWSAVEAANFPIKIGATYRWGTSEDLWNFEFLAGGEFQDQPRPGKFEGQRSRTAFQVDRAIYDKILLDNARSLGAKVLENTKVTKVHRTGDHVDSLDLDNGDDVKARWYLDCSGHSGLLRRAMGVDIQARTKLQNIAIWDYWQNAEWASTVGIGGTRIMVLSLGYGWLWFIPLSPTRTSLGLVIPAEYYKSTGKTAEELYRQALSDEPIVAGLIKNATRENALRTTKDWSFLSERLAGENWFLVGESAGFADPILSAGVTLAHTGARQVAYSIIAADKKEHDMDWLRDFYDESNRRRIGHHIRFADFWYSANVHFSDLVGFTSEIAKDAGLKLTPEEAWQWIGTGGFIGDDLNGTGLGAYSFLTAHHITGAFTGGQAEWVSGGKSRFEPRLDGAELGWTATFDNGRITRHQQYMRDGKILPLVSVYALIIETLQKKPTFAALHQAAAKAAQERRLSEPQFHGLMKQLTEALEAMVRDGWVEALEDPTLPPAPSPGSDGFVAV